MTVVHFCLMCVCVCDASCCAGSDKGGSRGLELIKCNDAMWGDLAVCVLIKKPPYHQQEKKKKRERERKIVKKNMNVTERGKYHKGIELKMHKKARDMHKIFS